MADEEPLSEDERTELRRELLDVVRAFRDKEIIPHAARYDAEDIYPEAIVEGMKELGLFGITVPQAFGGLGLDIVTYAMIVEELAYGWMSVSGFLNTHFMGCFLIKTFGTEEQKQYFLPRMATGEIRGAYSLSEPDAGSDVAAIRTRAVRDGDDLVVNGTKMWLTNGREAGVIVALVKTDPDPASAHRGMSVLLIEKEPGATTSGGITVGPNIHKLGYRGVETVEVVFDDHRMPADHLLGGSLGRVLPDDGGGRARADQHRGAGGGRGPPGVRGVDPLRPGARDLRQADRPAPGDPVQAGRDGHQAARRAAHGLRRGREEEPRRAHRPRGGHGEAVLLRGVLGDLPGRVPHPRRQRYAASTPSSACTARLLMIVGEGTSEIQKLVIGRRLLEDHAI
jgi:alkylation response protein AidB-like acyl-CoA dehydrogenase